jgi:protein O-mannosyl-transferase
LLSKPMLVSLPITLLLLDFWPLRRFEPLAMEGGWRQALMRLVREKLPLFGLSAVFCGVALWAQSSTGAVQSVQAYPLWVRTLNALDATVGYLQKMVWPTRLAVFYPHPGHDVPVAGALAAGLAIIAVTVLAVRVRRTRPYLAVGWLWYLVTLLPVVGLVQIGSQAMADRYTYVPLLGIFIAIAFLVPDVLSGLGDGARRATLTLLSVSVLVALIPVSYAQVGVWRDPESLFGHAIAVTKDNATAHNSYGYVIRQRGDLEGAIKHFREALRIAPEYLDARYNYAVSLRQKGDLPGAERELKRLLKQYPRHPYAQNDLGDICSSQRRFGEAIGYYKLALRDLPDEAVIHNSLGICLVQTGKVDAAIAEFDRAVKLDPSLVTAQDNLDRARALKE